MADNLPMLLTPPVFDDYLADTIDRKAADYVPTPIVTPDAPDEAYWASLMADIDANADDHLLLEEPAQQCRYGRGWDACETTLPADQLIDGYCSAHAAEMAKVFTDMYDQVDESQLDNVEPDPHWEP